MKNVVVLILINILSVVFFPVLLFSSLVARYKNKKIDIGLGPQPLINNLYHKKSLERYGFTAETFVIKTYYITSGFDKNFTIRSSSSILKNIFRAIMPLYIFVWSILRFRILYIYFNGGGLGLLPGWLWKIEPLLYRIAKVKTLVMPYGSDVQVMTRSQNLLFKNAMSADYPEYSKSKNKVAKQIDIWTLWGDHIISGVEWVDYMYHWDTLMLAHFSIDTEEIKPDPESEIKTHTFRIFHAPNHKEIKGTKHLITAVNALIAEGMNIELDLTQKVSNDEILNRIRNADLVADQFIIGWYAMFALEAMSIGKPVLCYLRKDLVNLYEDAGLVEKGEIPLISCSCSEIKNTIADLYNNREELNEIGHRSREYVVKHHSLDSIGKKFLEINNKLGVEPRNSV